jgi:membrane associated rhomboid family serine protease
MLVLFPYSTDAPIYHFPKVTIGLIVVNVAVFIATLMLVASGQEDAVQGLMLSYGAGLRPWQWITSNFIHGDSLHLVGNCFFLWAFGLIIEGKLGGWRYLAVFSILAIVECAIEQTLALGLVDQGPSFGASSVCYGLMALALVWAPRNDLMCWGVVGVSAGTFEVPITVFAGGYFGLQLLGAWLGDWQLATPVLHLLGVVVGFPLAVVMLQWRLVDCEGWDLFSVWAGREGEGRETPVRPEDVPVRSVMSSMQFGGQVRELLDQGRPELAADIYARARAADPRIELGESDLTALIKSLHASEHWSPSISPMVEYLRRFPEKAQRVRLRLAQVLVQHEHRPAQALRVLAKLPEHGLPPHLEHARQKLVDQASRLRDEGIMEMAGEDW